jgi:hypothetical protein
MRAAFLAARGLAHTPEAVARVYGGLIDGFVVDERDADSHRTIAATGTEVLAVDTLAPAAARSPIAREILAFGRALPRRQ